MCFHVKSFDINNVEPSEGKGKEHDSLVLSMALLLKSP